MNVAFQARIDAVRERVPIEAVVAAAGVRLGRGRKPRGKCPFHGSKSDSFMVDSASGNAKCWGCGWFGDAIKFTAESYGLSFTDALARLESDHGLDGLAALEARPKRYEKQARAVPDRPHVDSAVLGRFIWKSATRRHEAVRTYFRARGVPEAMLGDERLGDIRFHGLAPLTTWPADRDGPAPDAPKAPAIAALVRRPIVGEDGEVVFTPCGLHVTFLAPGHEAKMVRPRFDGSLYPDRKMMGDVAGGCVLLGRLAEAAPEGRAVAIDGDAPLYPGEGIETVLSGMALAGAPAHAIGLAALSLDNLQGPLKLWKGGVWPLCDVQPDPERGAALCFPHRGPVTVLVDADMAPLRGPRDRVTGERLGLPVVEHRGAGIVQRALSASDRAEICAELAVKAWRAAGSRRVTALRPRMGLDCNDAIREMEHV